MTGNRPATPREGQEGAIGYGDTTDRLDALFSLPVGVRVAIDRFPAINPIPSMETYGQLRAPRRPVPEGTVFTAEGTPHEGIWTVESKRCVLVGVVSGPNNRHDRNRIGAACRPISHRR